tara:strand:- start:42 stop:521 length:480 start_codon:yes stop_codon:yes gene_type:complete
MKFFSIDEDIMNSLIDLITEAYLSCKAIGDDDSALFYSYLIDELEHATVIGKGDSVTSEEQARMKKLERYLRMLHEGLKDPKDKKKNKERRNFARDIIDNNDKKKEEEVPEIIEIKPLTKQEILEAQFEAYYQRREEKKAKTALQKMLKEIGIEPYKKL